MNKVGNILLTPFDSPGNFFLELQIFEIVFFNDGVGVSMRHIKEAGLYIGRNQRVHQSYEGNEHQVV